MGRITKTGKDSVVIDAVDKSNAQQNEKAKQNAQNYVNSLNKQIGSTRFALGPGTTGRDGLVSYSIVDTVTGESFMQGSIYASLKIPQIIRQAKVDAVSSASGGTARKRRTTIKHGDSEFYEKPEMADVMHYGVLGMKWGIRRTPEQLGHRPKYTKEEKKERKNLIRATTAAQRNLKERSKNTEQAKTAILDAEVDYSAKLAKTVFPWNREKKQAMIEKAGDRLDKLYSRMELPNAKRQQALKYAQQQVKALTEFGERMNEKYGEAWIKQINTKNVEIGSAYAYNFVKTGVNLASIPVLGNIVSAKYISDWEREDREELMKRRSEALANNRYYAS